MATAEHLYPATGQESCHDTEGRVVSCLESGQDAAFRKGAPWSSPRFHVSDQVVHDRLTGLMWPQDASLAEFPLDWSEALAFVQDVNHQALYGYRDWRLPNRRELRSLMSYQDRLPALPRDHPFEKVFSGWYWSSTTAAIAPAHAWCVHMEGARMFYGGKDQYYMVWPVRGKGNGLLAKTGQILTRQVTISVSAVLCRFTARHRNAAVVILQQVAITPTWIGTGRPNLFHFNGSGATGASRLGVASLDKDRAIACAPRLDTTGPCSPEPDIVTCWVNALP